MNIHWQYSRIYENKNELFLGVGAEYKRLVPRLSTQADINLKMVKTRYILQVMKQSNHMLNCIWQTQVKACYN